MRADVLQNWLLGQLWADFGQCGAVNTHSAKAFLQEIMIY